MAFETFDVEESNLYQNEVNELTLDEPVSETLLRDLKSIWLKTKKILKPFESESQEAFQQLQDWDLWGPLLFCLILSTCLSITTNSKDSGEVFTMVFSLFWLGAAVVTLNAKLLQGKVSFFQTLCVLGYCIFPLVLCSVVLALLHSFRPSEVGSTFVLVYDLSRFAFIIICWLWSNKAVVMFISKAIDPKKRVLAVYPAFLLYSSITWLLIT